MKKIITILVIGLITLFFTGCGGGSTGTNEGISVDESKNSLENSEGETSLGFYGSDVYIGNHSGNIYWRIESEGFDGHMLFELPNFGNELQISVITGGSDDIFTADYGVSANGLTVYIDLDFDSSADLKIDINTQVDSQTYNAFILNLQTGEGYSVKLIAIT